MNGSSWSRFAQRSGYNGFLIVLFALCPAAFSEISVSNCARAAKYSESRHGSAMLVMQNGRTIFEHYANGDSPTRRWPIFSGTKSFWGIAALAAAQEGLFRLDDPVSDTITEWKSDPRKSQITIRQLLSQTDGIEGASRLQRASIRDRNVMAIALPSAAEPGSTFIYGPSHLQIFSELLRRKLRGRSVCICKDATADMVVALGSHYQRLFIIPSLKAVIVRQGSGGNFSDAQFLRLVLGRME